MAQSPKPGTWDPAEIDLSEDRKQYEQLDGRGYDPPSDERGLECLMALYERRMWDIFG